MERLFAWALSEPDLSELELEDDKGWHLVFRQTAPFLWPEGRRNMFENDHLADNFAKLHKLETFRHENGEFMFKLRWPLARRKDAIWAQTSNPLTSTTVTGYRPIKIRTRLPFGLSARSFPLYKSPDSSKALMVGGHPSGGEGAFFAIGHRLKRQTFCTWLDGVVVTKWA